ncbi:DUF423 domain-containing protein [Niveispirillum lacus]|uniref:DUF423 domain-containing protein n=1 Tax=Niveispirillum lacus TaxID=1981099 RepID=UPI001FE76763|nr:DUF423 domain-containing protein [Niveispirillum lacus]
MTSPDTSTPPTADPVAARLMVLAGLFGAVAVAAGAFASHGLATMRGPNAVDLWKTASQYQMVHALGILALVGLRRALPAQGRWLAASGLFFAIGCLLFPGALYALGWYGPSAMGAVAPIGGLCFILGWLLAGIAGLRSQR